MGNNEKISGRIWKPLVGRFCETPRRLAQTPYNLITEGFFTVVRGGQSIFADCDCGRAGVLDLVGLDSVELDVFCVFRRNVCVRIDGVHRANLHARHAIDAVVGMNYDLGIHLVEARDRADFYAVGEFASVTFLGHNVGHSASVITSDLREKLCYEY